MDPQQATPLGHEVPIGRPEGDMIPLVSNPEQTAAAPEVHIQPVMPIAQAAVPDPIASAVPPTAPPMPLPSAAPAATGTAVTPATADDVDLIEKEWVDRAKAIVAQTRNDPYVQNREMNKVKADYMMRGYQKEIRVEP